MQKWPAKVYRNLKSTHLGGCLRGQRQTKTWLKVALTPKGMRVSGQPQVTQKQRKVVWPQAS